ncbi:MAG: hypothetical protein ABUS51_01355 [Acidobacteriota bacterium]
MVPGQLTAESFAGYPAGARRVIEGHIDHLRQLPLAFVPLLLRELIVYDYKFPMERRDLDRQLRYLASLDAERLRAALAPFAQLRLTGDLERVDWVNNPAVFTEQLTAHLWATHQIDAFRAAAIEYVGKATAAFPNEPLPTHRLGIAAIGQGVKANEYRLFRKLRPQGTYFTNVQAENGLQEILKAVAKRAAAHPEPYSHWYIDGGASAPVASEAVTRVSYAALSPARAALQMRMQKIYEASVFDPEAFRTTLAQTKPNEIGLSSVGDPALNRFELSLLTEGSGTQVFATTFVQWGVREALRRAEPLTLFARFAPRQREKQMNELLMETLRKPELDAPGSLVDADMGAYYHWLNQQRLPGAEQSAFLVWFEDHGEAVAIAPGIERGKTSEGAVGLAELVGRLA